jgi:hypothetical protein
LWLKWFYPPTPLRKGGFSGSLPFIRGGLGWGRGLRCNSNRLCQVVNLDFFKYRLK